MNRLASIVTFALVAALGLTAQAHEPGDENKPDPPLAMRVIAPSAKGTWLLRIDNIGDEPARIAADVRLLTFEVRVPVENLKRPNQHGYTRTATVCDGPKAFGLENSFPGGRELVLEPGTSYVEEFDPQLICFGKDAELLVPGARVTPRYGFATQSAWVKTGPAAPFVADAAKRPRRFRPLRRLPGATFTLSHSPPVVFGPPPPDGGPGANASGPGGKAPDGKGDPAAEGPPSEHEGEWGKPGPERPKPPSAEEATRHRPRVPQAPVKRPPPDELGARMTLTTTHYDDAQRATDVQLSVQAHNTGERPVFVALRPRMLDFVVRGPDGVVRCRRTSQRHLVPRDLFRTLHHGKHVHMDVLLAEVCPQGTFDRPGLYRAMPILHADANGQQYGLQALTGVVSVSDPGDPGGTHDKDDDVTLIRVRDGRKPFYRDEPATMPTRVLPQE